MGEESETSSFEWKITTPWKKEYRKDNREKERVESRRAGGT